MGCKSAVKVTVGLHVAADAPMLTSVLFSPLFCSLLSSFFVLCWLIGFPLAVTCVAVANLVIRRLLSSALVWPVIGLPSP